MQVDSQNICPYLLRTSNIGRVAVRNTGEADLSNGSEVRTTFHDSNPTTGYVLAIVSSFASGLSVVIGKWNLVHISPLLMNGLIFTIATIVLTATVLPSKGIKGTFHLTRSGWFWLLMFSVGSWLAIWAYWAGIQRMDPSLAAFLNRFEVPVAIALAAIFLKERFSRKELVGAALTIVGIVLMKLTLRMDYSPGFWLVLLGALLFGITEFLSKIAVRHVGPLILTYIRNMFLAVFYMIAVSVGGVSYDGLENVWIGVIALALAGPVLARLLYLMALKRVELSKVALISQIQPVFVVLIALLALGQLPTAREIAGGLILMAGCLIMVLSRHGNRQRFHTIESKG